MKFSHANRRLSGIVVPLSAIRCGASPGCGEFPDLARFGDLATGKTCLVRGMAAHHTGGAPVHSPTFTLVNQYGADPALYHLDLYRLGGPDVVTARY